MIIAGETTNFLVEWSTTFVLSTEYTTTSTANLVNTLLLLFATISTGLVTVFIHETWKLLTPSKSLPSQTLGCLHSVYTQF